MRKIKKSMDKVKIKRVARHKKSITAKDKILAGLGVGSALAGIGGMVNQANAQDQKPFVRTLDSKNKSPDSTLSKIWKNTFGVKEAMASNGTSDDINLDPNKLKDFGRIGATVLATTFGGGVGGALAASALQAPDQWDKLMEWANNDKGPGNVSWTDPVTKQKVTVSKFDFLLTLDVLKENGFDVSYNKTGVVQNLKNTGNQAVQTAQTAAETAKGVFNGVKNIFNKNNPNFIESITPEEAISLAVTNPGSEYNGIIYNSNGTFTVIDYSSGTEFSLSPLEMSVYWDKIAADNAVGTTTNAGLTQQTQTILNDMLPPVVPPAEPVNTNNNPQPPVPDTNGQNYNNIYDVSNLPTIPTTPTTQNSVDPNYFENNNQTVPELFGASTVPEYPGSSSTNSALGNTPALGADIPTGQTVNATLQNGGGTLQVVNLGNGLFWDPVSNVYLSSAQISAVDVPTQTTQTNTTNTTNTLPPSTIQINGVNVPLVDQFGEKYSDGYNTYVRNGDEVLWFNPQTGSYTSVNNMPDWAKDRMTQIGIGPNGQQIFRNQAGQYIDSDGNIFGRNSDGSFVRSDVNDTVDPIELHNSNVTNAGHFTDGVWVPDPVAGQVVKEGPFKDMMANSDGTYTDPKTGNVYKNENDKPVLVTRAVAKIVIEGYENGQNLTINPGTAFTIPKATVFYTDGQTELAQVSGSVNVNSPGNYQLVFSNISGTSKVYLNVVVAETQNNGPTLTIVGTPKVEVVKGSTEYVLPTATAFDYVGRDISNKITVSGTENVKLGVVGSYTIIYRVTDEYGKTATQNVVIEVKEVQTNNQPGSTSNGVDLNYYGLNPSTPPQPSIIYYISPFTPPTSTTPGGNPSVTTTINWFDDGSQYTGGTGASGGCFIAGTKVALAGGGQKNIEDLKNGDIVLSRAEHGGQTVANKIFNWHFVESPGYLEINGMLGVTPEHIVKINGTWQAMGTAKVGDVIFGLQNEEIKVETINWQSGLIKVYNFTVENTHTYFANGIWVHNLKVGPGGSQAPTTGGGGYYSDEDGDKG
jgi:hypothetical protein